MGEGGWNPDQERQGNFSEAERLLAWLVEVGSGGDQDAQQLQQKRTQLQDLFKVLGVINDKGQLVLEEWQNLACQLHDSKQVALVPESFPRLEKFSVALALVKKNMPQEIISNIQPRGNYSEAQYVRSIAAVMANRLVYETIFADDPIEYAGEYPSNGRHRWLTMKVLNELQVNTHEWSWVK